MHKPFLEYILSAIVSHPEDIVVTEVRDDMGIFLTVDVNKDDMGSIVGRMGNTAKAIRTLLHVYGMQHGARISLKINEPVGGTKYIG
jgi:predicted RNA-binding protein YlqC (UPF0109 family)